MPAFVEDLETAAALVTRFDASTLQLSDTGSYLELRYHPFAGDPNDGLELTLFPFDTSRVRLGALWEISVAGDELLRRDIFYQTPGARVSLRRGVFSAWAAMKAMPARVARFIFTDTSGGAVAAQETQYAALGAASVDVLDERLLIEAGGGYFQEGETPDAARTQLRSAGGQARVCSATTSSCCRASTCSSTRTIRTSRSAPSR